MGVGRRRQIGSGEGSREWCRVDTMGKKSRSIFEKVRVQNQV